jgi:nucleoside-diphosphate-sugar epimerase
MRILVIGGTNFIGPHVVRELHGRGHDVTVYHRGMHEPVLPAAVRHIHSSRASIPFLHFPLPLSDPPPDVVLHMFPVGEADTKAAIARFIGVARRIVAISSGDVYRAYGRLLGSEPGPPETVLLTEDAPVREALYPYRNAASGPNDWTYHYEKILVERVLFSGRLPATVLRLPAVYGPGDPYHRFRPYIKRMQDGRPVILLDASQAAWRWSHGYVEDMGRAIATVTLEDRAVGKVYNVGEAVVPTVEERVRRIGELMAWTGRVATLNREQLPEHLRVPYEPRQDLVMDTQRVRSELGWKEAVSADDGMRRTIEWEHANSAPGDPTPAEYGAEDRALGRT